MAVVVIIYLMIKFWPITLLFLGLIIWGFSSSGSSSSSGSNSSGYYPSCSSHSYDDDYDDDDFSSSTSTSSSNYNDYYDFSSGVSSDKMYENAAWLAEEDPETYSELGMGDW